MFALRNPLRSIEERDEDASLQWLQNVFLLNKADGTPLDKHCPNYVVEPQPLINTWVNNSMSSASRLVLSDFGAGMFRQA